MRSRFILPVVAVLAVASCGKHGAEHGHGQVAAKVNGHEITVLEVNSVLARLGTVKPSDLHQATDGVVKNLVNQELLVQQAIKKKLDRNPQVLQAILESRKQILAQAYLERRFDTLSPPTNSAIMDFYNHHPDLFSQRKLYRVESIVIENGASKIAVIRNGLNKIKSPAAFLTWLGTQHMKFHSEVVVRAAEQVPLPLLKQLSGMKPGQTVLGKAGPNAMVLVLLAEKGVPLTLAQARPAIKNFLVNRDRQNIAKETLKKLRASSRIKYFGAYAGAAEAKSVAPTSAAKTGVSPAKSGLDVGKALQ